MTVEIITILVILGTAVLFFVTEWLRMDLVALLVLLSLAVTGLINPEEAVSGFSNPAVVTVWAVFILSGGLSRTGVAGLLGRQVLRMSGRRDVSLVVLIMLVSGVMSAFMNNVGVTALLLPVVMDMARRTGRPPSKLLIPLAFSSLLGGLTTLIGTPPNILVSHALQSHGFEPFGLFDFTPVGGAVMVAGIGFMAVVGRRLLPTRDLARESSSWRRREQDDFEDLRDKLFVLRLREDSKLAGKTLAESRIRTVFGLNVIGIIRTGQTQPAPGPRVLLEPGDELIVEGRPNQWSDDLSGGDFALSEEALTQEAFQGLDLDPKMTPDLDELETEQVGFAEVVLSPHAGLAGKTLRELHFRDKFGLTVLGVCRGGVTRFEDLGDLALSFGDALLLHGSRAKLKVLGSEPDFLVLTEHAQEVPRTRKAPISMGVMGLFVGSVIFGLLPVYIAAMAGAVLMILTGCLSMDEAYRAISWRAVFLIAGMLPVGLALERTGAADMAARGMMDLTGEMGPMALVAGLFIMTALAAQIMPTAAVAILMAPIALNAASDLGYSPYALLMSVSLAASASFMSPVAHPANVLIMGPGGYRFTDYIKVGIPLTLVIFLVVWLVLPIFWPLNP